MAEGGPFWQERGFEAESKAVGKFIDGIRKGTGKQVRQVSGSERGSSELHIVGLGFIAPSRTAGQFVGRQDKMDLSNEGTPAFAIWCLA